MLKPNPHSEPEIPVFSQDGWLLMFRPQIWIGLLLLLLGCALLSPRGSVQGKIPDSPNGFHMKDGILPLPESERPLDVCVIGVDPGRSPYFSLPFLQKSPGMTDRQFQAFREQMSWLNFEISHGRLLSALPSSTQIY